jgi:hypothetical protein
MEAAAARTSCGAKQGDPHTDWLAEDLKGRRRGGQERDEKVGGILCNILLPHLWRVDEAVSLRMNTRMTCSGGDTDVKEEPAASIMRP